MSQKFPPLPPSRFPYYPDIDSLTDREGTRIEELPIPWRFQLSLHEEKMRIEFIYDRTTCCEMEFGLNGSASIAFGPVIMGPTSELASKYLHMVWITLGLARMFRLAVMSEGISDLDSGMRRLHDAARLRLACSCPAGIHS